MRHLLIPAAMLLMAVPAFSQGFSAKAFVGHRRAAADAVRRADLVQAQAEIDKAKALLPSAPSVLLMGAQIALAAGKPEEARAWLKDYIRRGLWFDPARHADLAAVLEPADRTALNSNGTPLGTFATVARLDDLRLVEGVAVVKDKVWYSTIHDGALNLFEAEEVLGFDIQQAHDTSEARIAEKVREIVAKAKTDNPRLRIEQVPAGEADVKSDSVYTLPEGRGAYGIAANGAVIWMAVSPDQAATASSTALPSEVIRIDTATPSTPTTFAGPANSRFGDIAVGKTGIYVSDGGTGAVLRLNPTSGAWDTVVPAGHLSSPQGLAESADGKTLIVADYTSGLYAVDLASGEVAHLAVPDTASLIGVDGVVRSGQDLIAVQNGIQPSRVLRIHMKSDWKSIDSVDIILRGGELDEPTNGTVSGNRYVFVTRSQWSDFNGEGKPKATHGPAIIGEIELSD